MPRKSTKKLETKIKEKKLDVINDAIEETLEEQNPTPYSAFIKVLGKEFRATGSTIPEAISNLKAEGVAKGTSILKIKKGIVTREKILSHFFTTRLFSASKLGREIAIKNISALFNL